MKSIHVALIAMGTIVVLLIITTAIIICYMLIPEEVKDDTEEEEDNKQNNSFTVSDERDPLDGYLQPTEGDGPPMM